MASWIRIIHNNLHLTRSQLLDSASNQLADSGRHNYFFNAVSIPPFQVPLYAQNLIDGNGIFLILHGGFPTGLTNIPVLAPPDRLWDILQVFISLWISPGWAMTWQISYPVMPAAVSV